MKKIIIVCMLFTVTATGAFAQVQGKIRGGLNLGFCIPKGGIGVALDAQLGYNLKDNMNIGIKYGLAAMAKIDPSGESGSVSANNNILGTFSYYFNSGEGSFVPFVGGGIGIYTLGSITVGSEYSIELGPRPGILLTTGFEASKFRLGLEYNIVPSSAVKFNGSGTPTIENNSVKNSYLAITAGFYIGGGKWKK